MMEIRNIKLYLWINVLMEKIKLKYSNIMEFITIARLNLIPEAQK